MKFFSFISINHLEIINQKLIIIKHSIFLCENKEKSMRLLNPILMKTNRLFVMLYSTETPSLWVVPKRSVYSSQLRKYAWNKMLYIAMVIMMPK